MIGVLSICDKFACVAFTALTVKAFAYNDKAEETVCFFGFFYLTYYLAYISRIIQRTWV